MDQDGVSSDAVGSKGQLQLNGLVAVVEVPSRRVVFQ